MIIMKKQISIEGMSCMHCVMRVEKALKGMKGVKSAAVNLEKKNAVVEADSEVTDAELKAAVEDAGYDVTGITSAF
jgi:copper chaperone